MLNVMEYVEHIIIRTYCTLLGTPETRALTILELHMSISMVQKLYVVVSRGVGVLFLLHVVGRHTDTNSQVSPEKQKENDRK